MFVLSPLRNKRSIELVCKGGGNEIKLNQEGQTSKELSKETIAAQFLNGGSLISDSACDKDDGSTKSVSFVSLKLTKVAKKTSICFDL